MVAVEDSATSTVSIIFHQILRSRLYCTPAQKYISIFVKNLILNSSKFLQYFFAVTLHLICHVMIHHRWMHFFYFSVEMPLFHKFMNCTCIAPVTEKKYISPLEWNKKYISSIAQIHKVWVSHIGEKPQRNISALLVHRKLIPGAAKSNNANCFILQEILYKFSTKIININFTVCHTQNFTAFPLLHLVAPNFYIP